MYIFIHVIWYINIKRERDSNIMSYIHTKAIPVSKVCTMPTLCKVCTINAYADCTLYV